LIDWSQPEVIPALTRSLYDTNLETLESLYSIAIAARTSNSVGVLPKLQSAYDMLLAGQLHLSYGADASKELRRAVDHLRALEEHEQTKRSSSFIHGHPAMLVFVLLILVPPLAWFGFYAVAPLYLFRFIRKYKMFQPFENMARIRDARMSHLIAV